MAPIDTRGPFTFETFGEPLTIESAVFQAVGAASVCWETMNGTGPFDSDKAREIAETLVEFFDSELDAAVDAAVYLALAAQFETDQP